MNILSARRLNANLRIILPPVLVIAVSLVLLTFAIKLGIENVVAKKSEYEKTLEDNRILRGNIQVLREVKEKLDETENVVLALPSRNPLLTAMAQLKEAVRASSLNIDSLKVESIGGQKDLGESKFSVVLSGNNLLTLLEFLSSSQSLLPLMNLNNVRLSKKNETYQMQFEVRVFWSDFPTVLPPINQPIKSLTEREESVISSLLKFQKPPLVDITPQPPSVRTQPFD